MRSVFFFAIMAICTVSSFENLANKNVDVSSEQTAANTYDDGLYPERTTTSNSDHVVSSRQTAANTYDDVLFLERTTTSNSDHVVSSGQTAANTYDDGLYPEQTTTSNSDHVVYSGQRAPNTYDDGLYLERNTTSNSDHVLSSGQTAANTYDDSLYPERTTTSNFDHVVSSGQTAVYTYADGLYPERTTTSNFDHVVSSGQTAANSYDDGLYPEQITASKSDHRGSSVQTAAYTYEDGLYVERTTPSIFNNGIFSKGSILFRYDNRVYPVSSIRVKYDHGAYPKKTTYKYANGAYQAKISTSKYVNGLNAESVVASNVYHGVYPEGETLYSNGNGVNVKRTTSSKYDADVHPDGTTIYINNYEPTEDINPQGQSRQTTTNKYALGIHLKHGVYREQTKPTIFDKSVLPEWTTRYKYDHSLYHKGTRTSKYGYGVYPEGTTEHLYDNGVTTDPEEKTRLESNVEYGQDFRELLQECRNGTLIQQLSCDPSLTHNISLVNGIIPYFSDLRIFFADDFQNCKELFNKFIKSKNNVVSNADVHDFLSNDSTCLELASFTNKLVFLMKSNKMGSLFTAYIFPYVASNYIQIYVILKQHSCRDGFYQYVNMKSQQLSDAELALSIDSIIDFSQVNDCLDVRFSCSTRQHFCDIFIFVPDSAAAYVHMGMAVEVTMVNGFVLFIFLQKENRTPVTILLSFLAVSDVNMVILMILPVYAAPGEHVQHVLGLAYLYLFDFPKCLIYTFIDELKYVFHLTSVFITTLLCLQKTAALLFPMWSKRRLNNRVSSICSIIAFCTSICINSPKLIKNLHEIKIFNGRCCKYSSVNTYGYHYIIVNICFLVSCLVVAICTVYIICKLTCMRRNLPWTDSPVVQKRNRISAVTVVSICIIFLLSEAALFVTSFTDMLLSFYSSHWKIYSDMNYAVKQYTDISLIFGCSLNFIVYIVMSKQLRDKLVISVIRIAKHCKCR